MRRVVAIVVLMALAAASTSAFVVIDHWFTPDRAFADGFVDTAVTLDIDDVPSNEDIKVVFLIPELGVRSSKGFFDPSGLRHSTVHRVFDIPEDAEPGEYVIRMTVVDKQGNKRVRHRFIEIE